MTRFPQPRLFYFFLFLLITALNAGCAQETSEQEKQTAKPRVALIMKSLANEFFINMADGAKAHQTKHSSDYELIVNGIKNESDLTQQVKLVEQMLANQVNAIVIAPADSKALIPVLKRAVSAGIVVINIDNKLDNEILQQNNLTIPFVGPDNREGAKQVGDFLASKLSEKDDVAIIGGISTAFNAQQRQLGFEDALNTVGANIVSIQAGDWDQAKAGTIATALINEYPGLKAILCANDSMAIGAIAAVTQANKKDSIYVVGFDNISATHELIREGKLLATADQYGEKLAVFGIEYALSILKNGVQPDDRKTPVDLITASQVSQ